MNFWIRSTSEYLVVKAGEKTVLLHTPSHAELEISLILSSAALSDVGHHCNLESSGTRVGEWVDGYEKDDTTDAENLLPQK